MRDERLWLRAELADQQKEAQRLRAQMQQCEAAQPQHASQVDRALQELKAAMCCGGLDSNVSDRVADILADLARAQADTSQQQEARDQVWQQHLQEQLVERQLENDRLAAKAKNAERGGAIRQKSA